MAAGRLYLVPNLLGVIAPETVLPVAQWKKRDVLHYQNRPAIFLLGRVTGN